jgi:hypothetical protein
MNNHPMYDYIEDEQQPIIRQYNPRIAIDTMRTDGAFYGSAAMAAQPVPAALNKRVEIPGRAA